MSKLTLAMSRDDPIHLYTHWGVMPWVDGLLEKIQKYSSNPQSFYPMPLENLELFLGNPKKKF